MSINNDKESETPIDSEFSKLNISDLVTINHENCYQPYTTKKLWCKECVASWIIEGWTSGNSEIDNFIKDTIYFAESYYGYPRFLEWVPFDRFEDIKQIGEGGFSKVYSAKWIDGQAEYYKQDNGSWKKSEPKPINVALKRLNGSQNMSAEYLNELKIHWNVCFNDDSYLKFYGITKDPETQEFMMIMQFADQENLRHVLSSNINNILWKDKIKLLLHSIGDLKNLHELGYFHKDFHSGNILKESKNDYSFISDFGLSGPSNEQKSDDKICGVLPYIAPEVLNGEPYTLSSDIYSFGVVMTELSSGKPPFYKRKHDASLALEICNGLRPEFGKGTPDIYKKLAHRCMDANPNQRPTANKLCGILDFWRKSTYYSSHQKKEKFGYKGKEVKTVFKEADKEIPNISASYEKDPDAVYTSRVFTFNNLSKPVNSFIITSYLNEEENNKNSQIDDLDVLVHFN